MSTSVFDSSIVPQVFICNYDVSIKPALVRIFDGTFI